MFNHTYKNSKNKIHEFILESEKHQQYFKNMLQSPTILPAKLSEIKKMIAQQFGIMSQWAYDFTRLYAYQKIIYGLFGVGLFSAIGLCFHMSFLFFIFSLGLYICIYQVLTCYNEYIQNKIQNIFYYVQETETMFHQSMSKIIHIGLDCNTILQRICNQNAQLTNYLRYYHQAEEMLQFHQVDLQDLLKQLRNDYKTISSEDIEGKLHLLKKFHQEIKKNLQELEHPKQTNECSFSSKILIEKSLISIQKHHKFCIDLGFSSSS